MTPILLRLLLCLCLVVNATAGAWAATGMAMPAATPEKMATHAMPCHEGGAIVMAKHAASAMQDHPHDQIHSTGCKAGSCDCLQHCSTALAVLALLPTAPLGDTPLNWALHEGHGDPSPYRPVRPPIA